MTFANGAGPSHTPYARAALDRECELAATTGQGRNEQLNRSAFSIGQLVGAGLLDRFEAEQRLMAAAEASGYIGKDGRPAAQATIRSGLDQGQRQPRTVPDQPCFNGRGHAGLNGFAQQAPKPAPSLDHMPLPPWTEPGPDGRPKFIAIDKDEPAPFPGEIRRHQYWRADQVVWVKVKQTTDPAWIDWYHVSHPDGRTGWQAKRPMAYVPVPYVGDGNPFNEMLDGETLIWAEGEKDVDTLVRLGLAGFTFGSASDVPARVEDLLVGRDVVVVGDTDDAGRKFVQRAAERLRAKAKRVRTLVMEELAEGGDITDWIDAGGTPEQLWARIDPIDPTPKPRPKFILEPLASISPILTGSWLIKGLLPSCGLAVLYGPPGCGKSFVANNMGLHVAAGRDWSGRKANKAGVVYVASEGGEGFRKRVVGAREHHGLGDGDFALVTTAPNLGTEQGDAATLITCIKEQSAEIGFKAGLVILDTLARSMAGTDENNAKDMGLFIGNAALIERELGVLVVAVHHTGKDAERGMRGSSALHGATSAEWEIGTNETGSKTIRIAKMKDGEDDLTIQFRMFPVDVGQDEDGDPVTTLVVDVETARASEAKAKTRPPLKGQKAEFMKAVGFAIEASGEVPPTSAHIPPRVKCVTRHALIAYADKLGFLGGMDEKVRKSTLDRHIRSLAGDRYIGQWGDWLWPVATS